MTEMWNVDDWTEHDVKYDKAPRRLSLEDHYDIYPLFEPSCSLIGHI